MSNIRYFYNRCPYNNKEDLDKWASVYFKEPLYKFRRKKKDELYAIWYSVANKKEFVSKELSM